MITLDFAKIRIHDGSQDNGFEELVCQLARLNTPNNASYFVRKDGAGGDAGVECYWKLEDESEIGWQAKYFVNRLEDNQWAQINESVEAALNKHPDLTKYYVCLPRDWNDSRKVVKGTVVNSAWDKWKAHVAEWEKLAAKKGMSVEFSYWCKSEISQMLQTDKAEYSGRAHYWFEQPILDTESFSRLAEKSKKALGERYSPEYHLDLPISKVIEGLAASKSWWEDTEEVIKSWINSISKSDAAVTEAFDRRGNDCTAFHHHVGKLKSKLLSGQKKRTLISNIEYILSETEALSSEISELNKVFLTDSNKKDRRFRNDLFRYSDETNALNRFFGGKASQAALKQAVLLEGEAGIGKSHLLCDVVLSRLKDNLPTLFMLGQHYIGGDPLLALKKSVDLTHISNEEFLGALDAAGEARKTPALIVIDAINEGAYREDWRSFVSAFCSDVERFSHIGLVLSCRTTYLDWLIPEAVIGNQLLRVTHSGFKGYEHRAASIYLNKQGIVKPTVPIISPEFSNPLFLTTTCKALKAQGVSTFPKGLQGISRLMDFYISSADKTISIKKRFRTGENVIHKALNAIALELFPDNQFGIEISEARRIVNSFDSQPGRGESLFDELMDEGLLSEDVLYDNETEKLDKVAIRFTYERFSDYLIAESLLDGITIDDLENALKNTSSLSELVKPENRYQFLGVLAAFNILVAERFEAELIDYLPEGLKEDHYVIDRLFLDTLQWRDGKSFTDRTKEILNSIRDDGYHSERLNKIMFLAPEPGHPWNADMLHARLMKLTLPERDRFWSVHLAVSDSEEGEGEEESVIRSLINWGQSGSLEHVDKECVRLCSTTLIWMTATSNRKVRDQATKSATRLLTHFPELTNPILESFKGVDDLYVAERIYAVAYGVVVNISNKDLIEDIALWVFEQEFRNGCPTPHILLRDYASGLIRYALSLGLLWEKISSVEEVKPPYKSAWPLENILESDIEKLEGDNFSSRVKSSLMGFPGDFGNYIMGCVHRWSTTPIDQEKPQTAYELQVCFGNKYLEGDLRGEFLNYVESLHRPGNDELDLSEYFRLMEDKFDSVLPSQGKSKFKRALYTQRSNNQKSRLKKRFSYKERAEIFKSNVRNLERKALEVRTEKLKGRIKEALTEEGLEEYRWVMGLGRSAPIGEFSRKKAQRWVCNRVYEMGWSQELFEDFERYYTAGVGRSESTIERIGKKYQWIAFHEFLAYLSDNCCYIDPGYSDVDKSRYFGPWQEHLRDIDPTIQLRKTGDNGWLGHNETYWWQPYAFEFTGKSLNELSEWLWDEDIAPPFQTLLQVENAEAHEEWLTLKSFSHKKKDPEEDAHKIPYQDFWYRINSCIIHKNDLSKFQSELKDKNLCDPHILSPPNNGHQGFLREFPWHPSFVFEDDWNTDLGFGISTKVKNLVPYAQYEWESGSTDKSLDESIKIYMPSAKIIEALSLTADTSTHSSWIDASGNLLFIDPSTEQEGPSTALINKQALLSWLEDNDLVLVWLVGGEKQLFTEHAQHFYGRHIYSGVYHLTQSGVEGSLWFIQENPSP